MSSLAKHLAAAAEVAGELEELKREVDRRLGIRLPRECETLMFSDPIPDCVNCPDYPICLSQIEICPSCGEEL